MDVGALLKAKQAWGQFKDNHPKFEPFLGAVKQRGISEGTVIGIDIKYPDGGTIKTNVKVTESDLELIDLARSMLK